MVKDRILDLKNGVSYYILEEIVYNDKKYVMACACDTKSNYVNEDDYVVMEITINNDDLVLENIKDLEVANVVTKLLIEKVRSN